MKQATKFKNSRKYRINCPDCGRVLEVFGGCSVCIDCGYSPCG
jgi:ribosomal protein S27E